MRRRTPLIPVAVAALALLATAFAPPASAAPEEEVATGLIGPLSLAVAPDGTAFVAQSFVGVLTEAVPGGAQTDIYADEGGREVAGVSVEGDILTFTTTGLDHKNPSAHVYQLGPDGQHTLANVWKYEKANNPDGGTKYGLVGTSKSCKKKTPKFLHPYKGILESHPYATNVDAEGVTYLADAAGNSILSITDAGAIDTVAVIPPVKVKPTKKIRNTYDLPKCTKGGTIKLEGVPTDVEMGPDGNLYVTSLPGGPEDDSLGHNGAVYQVNPTTGAVVKSAGGLVTPTGLAIGPTGTAYISLLGPGLIMQQPFGGEPSVFAEVPFPGDVEVIDGYVYATETNLAGANENGGRVLRWSLAD